jgi:hypothetical protein
MKSNCSNNVAKFLDEKLSSKQKQVLEFLKGISEDACELYKGVIFAFRNEHFPARDVYLASCTYKLMELL